jgi:4-amino-4-deoxy-L-arabinose transferase-like glycosyltransferase
VVLRQMKKEIIGILLVSLLISLSGVYLFSQNEKYVELLPDYVRNLNTVKYVTENGIMPKEIENRLDGSTKGIMDHRPTYYYLSAGLIKITGDLDETIVLQIFSVFIIFLTNILFYLFLRKVFNKKKQIIYTLALFCFLPLHLFISMIIGPDPLFYLTFILSLYLFVVLKERKDFRSAVIFGLSVGLVLLTRVYGIILIAGLFIYTLYEYGRKSEERRLFLISSIVGGVFGSYGIFRNILVFGKFLPSVPDPISSNVHTFIRLFGGFWSGLYNGASSLRLLLIICVAILVLAFVIGFFKYYRTLNKKDHLLFLGIICSLFFLQAINLTCNFTGLINGNGCAGDAAQNRYLIPFEPFLAIFIGFGFYNLGNRKLFKYLIPIFVIMCLSVFSLDFIYALK